jgi:hypothetical protein
MVVCGSSENKNRKEDDFSSLGERTRYLIGVEKRQKE